MNRNTIHAPTSTKIDRYGQPVEPKEEPALPVEHLHDALAGVHLVPTVWQKLALLPLRLVVPNGFTRSSARGLAGGSKTAAGTPGFPAQAEPRLLHAVALLKLPHSSGMQ